MESGAFALQALEAVVDGANEQAVAINVPAGTLLPAWQGNDQAFFQKESLDFYFFAIVNLIYQINKIII